MCHNILIFSLTIHCQVLCLEIYKAYPLFVLVISTMQYFVELGFCLYNYLIYVCDIIWFMWLYLSCMNYSQVSDIIFVLKSQSVINIYGAGHQ